MIFCSQISCSHIFDSEPHTHEANSMQPQKQFVLQVQIRKSKQRNQHSSEKNSRIQNLHNLTSIVSGMGPRILWYVNNEENGKPAKSSSKMEQMLKMTDKESQSTKRTSPTEKMLWKNENIREIESIKNCGHERRYFWNSQCIINVV